MTTTMMTETRNKKSSIALVITAAGSSTRMGNGQKKEFMRMPQSKRTVLSAAAEPFLSAIQIDSIVVTFPQGSGKSGELASREALLSSKSLENLFCGKEQTKIPALLFVEGGSTRQESVLRALEALEESASDIVLIHDGARPFVDTKIITDLLDAVLAHGAATCAIPPVDTQKESDGQGKILRHLNRSNLCSVQTPQGFSFKPLLAAHRKAAGDGRTYTDDTEIWAQYEKTAVHITSGSSANKKITFPGDLQETQAQKTETRTGFGYDLHRLAEGRKLLIGGVEIPFCKGELGHSDGDVLLHAITDAILGAAALGDIGEMFPPSDAKWKDANSKDLLALAWQRVAKAGWELGNLDCVVKLEKPKLLPFRDEIRRSIASILECSCDSIFVKAKTGEGLGCIGQGEAIEAFASCLISKRS